MLTDAERQRRETLRERKPAAAAKFDHYAEKAARGECVAQVQVMYRGMRENGSLVCNMRCEHCFVTTLPKTSDKLLTPEKVAQIADECDAMGLASMTITGGEPLIYPDLEAVIDAIGPRFHLAIDTNGYLLSERAAWLARKGVDKVQVSLDSYRPSVHDDFRRTKGAWVRAVNGMRTAQQAGMAVIASTVVTDERVDSWEFAAFVRFINSFGIPVFANPAKSLGEWKDQPQLATQHSYDVVEEMRAQGADIFTHLTPAYGVDLGCPALKRQFPILPDGTVLVCSQVQTPIGNVWDEPLAAIVARGMDAGWRERIDGCPASFGLPTPT